MTGGNIWQAALLGFVGGGVGGGVAGYIGARTAEGIVGGAVAGGAASGALRTALRGGKFFENVFGGALANGLLASVQVVAMKGWELAKEWTDKSMLEGSGQKVMGQDGNWRSDGGRICVPECTSLIAKIGGVMSNEGEAHWYDPESFFGRFTNSVSKVHDWMNGWTYQNGDYSSRGAAFDTAFDAFYNFPGMIPAAVYTGFAFYGNPYSYSVPLRVSR
jgi:hypothetical protein